MPEENKYTLLVNKKRISVSEEVYKAYYQQKEREDYLDKISKKHDMFFVECEKKGIQVEYILSLTEESIKDKLIEAEDKLIKMEMLAKLPEAVKKLSEQERLLIDNLFFNGKSQRRLSTETGIPLMTISDRNRRILKKLKKLLER